jgi:hypothetical protein
MSILALTSNTLIGTAAAGNIEYDGQFYGTDSAAARAQLQRITRGTAVASTSGTSIDFTVIPSWVKRITMMLQGVSTSGISQKLFQLGTGATPTYATSGYASNSSFIAVASSGTAAYTNGFNLYNILLAADTLSGIIVFANLTGNTWVCSGSVANTAGTVQAFPNGSITLGATLTAVRMTAANGTDTFDAGTINIMYEG